jgi:pimeloyl-ACP methyl ester carboxylesterase
MPVSTVAIGKTSEKPVLVLVHGLGSAGTIWKSLYTELQDHFHIYPLDLPGHGEAGLSDEPLDPRSLADAIAVMMEREHGITEFHVAGNSLGGWIALELAAAYPDRIKSVTALAPAGLWREGPTQILPPSIFARILAMCAQYFLRLAYHLPPLKAMGYRKITHLWRELSFESCKDSVLAMARSTGYMPMWRALRGRKFDGDIPPHIPTKIIFGDYDLTLPHPHAQVREVAPAHAEWIIVQDCAHVIMWNYPSLTVEFIAGHLSPPM